MNIFLLQLRSLLDGAEITAAAERSLPFRAIFPLKHQIVSRTAALATLDDPSEAHREPRPSRERRRPNRFIPEHPK